MLFEFKVVAKEHKTNLLLIEFMTVQSLSLGQGFLLKGYFNENVQINEVRIGDILLYIYKKLKVN